MKYFKYILRVLITPSCWMHIYPHDRDFDKWMRAWIEAGEIPVALDDFRASFRGKVIWIENKFYSFGKITSAEKTVMPSRVTQLMFFDAMIQNKKHDLSIYKDLP